MTDDQATQLFFELFSGLPRQGPGDPESTRRALSLLPPLGPGGQILDIGCGTGAQTLELARLSPASIVAVDLHGPFIEELARKAEALGVGARVRARVGDMARLEFAPASFDAIWSEGAIYFIGFEKGLQAWRRLLKPGGHMAVSELCWLKAAPPRECAEFITNECPWVSDITGNLATIERCGYRPVGHFTLPPSAWWNDYYLPLERNLAAFRQRHIDDPVALALADQTKCEIDLFRRYSDYYGYEFFVMQKVGD